MFWWTFQWMLHMLYFNYECSNWDYSKPNFSNYNCLNYGCSAGQIFKVEIVTGQINNVLITKKIEKNNCLKWIFLRLQNQACWTAVIQAVANLLKLSGIIVILTKKNLSDFLIWFAPIMKFIYIMSRKMK